MTDKKAPWFLFSVRFSLSILAFFAYAIQHAQNIAMSVAIVCMVNNTAIDLMHHNATSFNLNQSLDELTYIEDDCNSFQSHSNSSSTFEGSFEWPKVIQGIILSSYFFGYLITEIPGGWLALNYGATYSLAGMLLIGSIFTILLPFAARFNYIALICVRFIIGAALGGVWPAAAGFWSAWAPPSERSTLIGIANAGAQIGNVVTLQLGGILCVYGIDGGWPSIFYLFGALGLIWTVIWCIYSADSPSKHKFINNLEREYIEDATKDTIAAYKEGGKSAPWAKIMKSKTCLSLFFGHTCQNFGTYMFLTQLPTYMREILKFDIKSNGTLSAIPYLFFWLFIILSGILGDIFVNKIKLNKTLVRKIFNSFGFFVPMFSVIALCFVTCSTKYIGVFLLTLGLAFTGCSYGAGFSINYNDISGPYSGVVFGIGNSFATIPGIFAPYIVGILTKNKTQQEWQIVFMIAAFIYLIGIFVLLVFSSAEIEPWAVMAKKRPSLKEDIPLKDQSNAISSAQASKIEG